MKTSAGLLLGQVRFNLGRVSGLPCKSCEAIGCALLVIVAWGAAVDSAANEYRAAVWKQEDGLPANELAALCQDRNGYLWVGTREGLARFDGKRFKTFSHANTPVFVSDVCTSLAAGREDELWVGTSNGLLHFSAQGWRRFETKDGLADDRIRCVAVARNGDVWIGTFLGLNRLRGGQFTFFPPRLLEGDSFVDAIYEDRTGRVWIGEISGLRCWHPATDEVTVVELPTSVSGFCSAIAESPRGDLWFSSVDLFQLRDGMWSIYPRGLPTFTGSAFMVDRRNRIWAGGAQEGLFQFSGGAWRSLGTEGLSDPHVRCLFEDRDGNVWIGTDRGGLNQWQRRQFASYSVQDGLAHDNVWAVCGSKEGGVWVGTDGGVTRMKISQPAWNSVKPSDLEAGGVFRAGVPAPGGIETFTVEDGLPRNSVRALWEDRPGRLWIGTGDGVAILENGIAESLFLPGGLSGNKTRALLEDRSGVMWIARESGLARVDQGVLRAVLLGTELAQPDIRALHQDAEGTLWIGTFGKGLWTLDPASVTAEPCPVLRRLSTTNGLSDNFVWALHEDEEGTLWVGTERGLNRLRGARITQFTERQGLYHEVINGILSDGQGRLWISCDLGIYRVSKRELDGVAEGRIERVHSTVFNKAHGLLSSETNGQKSQPSAYRDPEGRLWFPTTRGVVVIDPTQGDLTGEPPRAVVEEVQADGEVAFENSSELWPSRKLPPGRGRVLRFSYTAAQFTAPDEVRFRHRLRGHSDRWIDAGRERIAYYTSLRPGSYEFEVAAAGGGAEWAEAANFRFRLDPHLWQTVWFRVLAGLSAIGVVYAGFGRWLRRRRRIDVLETAQALIRERERIAKDMHDEMGARLTQISLLAGMLPFRPDGVAAAAQVSSLARAATQGLDEIVWAIEPANDTIEQAVRYLSSFAEEFLASSPIRLRIQVPPVCPSGKLSSEMRHNFFLATKEALNNAVKHAGATEVVIEVQCTSGLTLRVRDNGCGCSIEKAKLAGNGLENMRIRMEQIGGRFEFESAPGLGTTVTLAVRLKRGTRT